VDAMLGIGVVFEIPVLFFFLTLIRVVSPAFLLKHSRYAILIIVTIAAIVTPTTDAFNLTLFSLPMCLLFFLGVFASYLLVLKRESRRFPWKAFLKWLAIALFVAGCAVVILLQSIVCSGGENQLRVVPWNRSSLAPEFHVHQSACQREESVPAAARPQPRGLAPVGGGSV
jgi:sec-independent protein translocase protein TatC